MNQLLRYVATWLLRGGNNCWLRGCSEQRAGNVAARLRAGNGLETIVGYVAAQTEEQTIVTLRGCSDGGTNNCYATCLLRRRNKQLLATWLLRGGTN